MIATLHVERREDIPAAVERARTMPVWDGQREVPVQHSEPYTVRRSPEGSEPPMWVVEWAVAA